MLLTLPRELRNQIYHHLWSSVPARALSTGHTAWYFCVPMPLSLLSNPIPVGLPSWLPTSRAMLQEGLEQFHIHGAIQTDLTYDHDLTFPPLLSPSNARNVQVTLRLAPVTASVAAVYREIERVDARGLARLGQATGDEQQIKIHIQFDREAHLACILDPSPIDLLMQDRIEIVVSGVQIGSEGELAVLRAAAELWGDFGDMNVQARRYVPPLPPPVGFGTGPALCRWWCVFWRDEVQAGGIHDISGR